MHSLTNSSTSVPTLNYIITKLSCILVSSCNALNIVFFFKSCKSAPICFDKYLLKRWIVRACLLCKKCCPALWTNPFLNYDPPSQRKSSKHRSNQLNMFIAILPVIRTTSEITRLCWFNLSSWDVTLTGCMDILLYKTGTSREVFGMWRRRQLIVNCLFFHITRVTQAFLEDKICRLVFLWIWICFRISLH